MKKESFETLVARSKQVYGDRFEYIREDREHGPLKLIMRCLIHGEFSSLFSNHIRGKPGCRMCTNAATSERRSHSLETIAAKAKLVHPLENYTYSRLDKTDLANARLTIHCPEHGEFQQSSANHLAGTKCPSCARKSRGLKSRHDVGSLKEALVERGLADYEVKEISYSEVSRSTYVNLTCPSHGKFELPTGQLLGGRKCPVCTSLERSYTLDSFSELAAKKHNNKYVYLSLDRSRPEYVRAKIICPIHGEFVQGITSHLKGRGCELCADDTHADRSRKGIERLVSDGYLQWGGTYSDIQVRYIRGHRTETTALCKEHGQFTINTSAFNRGQGCPECSKGGVSKLGSDFAKYIMSIETEAIPEVNIPFTNFRWDIAVPLKKIAFEFHGLFWHSTQYHTAGYHAMKHQKGLDAGFRTIHVFEDEWLNRRQSVEALVRSALGLTTNKVFARKCLITQVTRTQADEFLNLHHIQGATTNSAYLGLLLEDKLVAVLGYALRASGRGQKVSSEQAEITRYASSIQVVGGFSKLIAGLTKAVPSLKQLYTFSDIRLFTGNTYKKTGFKLVAELRPDYFYVRNGKRQHKCTLQKSAFKKNPKLLYDPKLTERELAELNNFHRVYDCGKFKWELAL